MAKGFFTQGLFLLTDGTTSIDHVRAALQSSGVEIAGEKPPQSEWQMWGPTLILPFRPEANGYAAVDLAKQAWPDTMGDPQSDPQTFAAWATGHFGPLAFPGGLERAAQHSWVWPAGRTVADGHAGFIRLRTSYGFGAKGSDPVFPDDYDPLQEMFFLSRTLLPLLDAPGVICYFNPNGEVLRDPAAFRETWDACEAQENLPLPLWMNVRFFNLDEQLAVMDTVGNGQLDIADVEAIFPIATHEPGDVDYYLRNVTHYLLGLDRELQTGEDIDGTGETDLSWTIEVLDEPLVEPPRRILRLSPKSARNQVRQALAAIGRSPA